MQLNIELPDTIAQQLQVYLSEHPDETFYSLVRDSLEAKLVLRNHSHLLKLAEIIIQEPVDNNDPWDVFISLGTDAEPGNLTNPSLEHDRYLYTQP
jgi:hypothetical protein